MIDRDTHCAVLINNNSAALRSKSLSASQSFDALKFTILQKHRKSREHTLLERHEKEGQHVFHIKRANMHLLAGADLGFWDKGLVLNRRKQHKRNALTRAELFLWIVESMEHRV